MKKIKIAIAEDQILFRKGVISLFKDAPQIKVVLEAENGKELIDKLDENNLPDIIFMDIRMPVLDGVKATSLIVKKFPTIKIIGLTMFNSDEYILQMHRAGAHGFLTKDSLLDDLLDAIDMCLNKGFYANAHTSSVLFNNADKVLKSNTSKENTAISKREIEIIHLICEEKTTIEIADVLSLSSRTVEWHKKNIFKKLNVKSNLGLMRYAMENGLL